MLNAVNFINTEINEALVGQDVSEQTKVDEILINLDGTSNKERLGANSLLAVSLANAHAFANCSKNLVSNRDKRKYIFSTHSNDEYYQWWSAC